MRGPDPRSALMLEAVPRLPPAPRGSLGLPAHMLLPACGSLTQVCKCIVCVMPPYAHDWVLSLSLLLCVSEAATHSAHVGAFATYCAGKDCETYTGGSLLPKYNLRVYGLQNRS